MDDEIRLIELKVIKERLLSQKALTKDIENREKGRENYDKYLAKHLLAAFF